MPDFFNTADSSHAPERAPQDWSEAFAALAPETPPGDGWSRIVHTLDSRKGLGHRAYRERRTTWVIGLASAAVLVMAAWSPLSHWLQDSPTTAASSTVAVKTAPGSREPAASVQIPASAMPDIAVDATPQPTPAANSGRGSNTALVAQPRPARAHTARKSIRNKAQPTPAQPPEAASTPTDSIAVTSATSTAIQDLQAQSARLEALVAIARDDRVGTASAELLSAEFDAGIAAVDASLSNDVLDDTQRQQLWQRRVDLLQQLAGIESTARWLAAQGMSSETALVSVD